MYGSCTIPECPRTDFDPRRSVDTVRTSGTGPVHHGWCTRETRRRMETRLLRSFGEKGEPGTRKRDVVRLLRKRLLYRTRLLDPLDPRDVPGVSILRKRSESVGVDHRGRVVWGLNVQVGSCHSRFGTPTVFYLLGQTRDGSITLYMEILGDYPFYTYCFVMTPKLR